MDVTLVARFFDMRNEGIGTYSKVLYEGLLKVNNVNIKTLSQDKSILNSAGKLGYLFYSFFEIPFKLMESDVYHALSPIESLWLNKKRSVVTVHDFILMNLSNQLIESKSNAYGYKLIFQIGMKNAVKCEKIVAISEETANEINKHYSIDLDEISVVRPAIPDHFKPKKIQNNAYIIGTVSSLGKRKRIDILIKAFLKANIKNSKLFIGGKGSELEYLKILARGDERIHFFGFIDNDNMNDFYNSLDVFVFPTIIEGYGLPLIEAMACSKPVITLSDALIPNDIKKRTYVTDKADLAKCLKNKSFDCDIESNLEFAKKHSIKNITKYMMNIYKDI